MARQPADTAPQSSPAQTEALLQLAVRRIGMAEAQITSFTLDAMTTGYSGSHLARARVVFRAPGSSALWRTTLVVKRIAAGGGWLGWATRDQRVREVQLWRTGLLQRLPRGLDAGVLVAEQHTDAAGTVTGGTLVMRDMKPYLLRHPFRAPPDDAPLLTALLDTMARLHAAYWQAPSLRDPQLGLMPLEAALTFAAPDTIAQRLALGDQEPYLREMPAAWQMFFTHIPRQACSRLQAILSDPRSCSAMLSRLPFTLVQGDVWGPNVGIRFVPEKRSAPAIVLLDWGLASAAPCTFDPLWLCATWPALDPVRMMARYRSRLQFHLRHRSTLLEPAMWLRLLDAGYLRTVLAGGEAFGQAMRQAPNSVARARAQRVAAWWATRASAAAVRLGIGQSSTS